MANRTRDVLDRGGVMPEGEAGKRGLTFDEYGAILAQIEAMRTEMRQRMDQQDRYIQQIQAQHREEMAQIRAQHRETVQMLLDRDEDKEQRLRRNETLVLLGFSLTIIAAIVVGAIVVLVVRP